jgi:hypothetical protein
MDPTINREILYSYSLESSAKSSLYARPKAFILAEGRRVVAEMEAAHAQSRDRLPPRD